MLTSAPSRRDGAKLWLFHALGVVENPPWARGGLVMANYDYYDRTRRLDQMGQVGQLFVLLDNPGFASRLLQPRSRRMFANSANPAWVVPDRVLAQVGGKQPVQHPAPDRRGIRRRPFPDLFLVANTIAQSVRERVGRYSHPQDAGILGMRA